MKTHSFLDGNLKHDTDLRGDGKPSIKNIYLSIAKENALNNNYNPDLLTFSNDGIHKLNYDGINFGRVGYNDFIIYQLMGDESALMKRKNYLARASKIKGNWKNNEMSPNNLAQKILWMG